MDLAQMIEDKTISERSHRSTSSGSPHQSYAPAEEQQTRVVDIQQEALKNQISEAHPGATFKYITEIEIQNKRAKGHCEEKYFPRHRFKDHTFQVLTMCAEEENTDETEVGVIKEEYPHSTTIIWIPS